MTTEPSSPSGRSWKRYLLYAVGAGFALFLLIQLVPYGHDHNNPAVSKAAVFKDPKVAQMVANSCGDCHSNLTKYPWYASVAPVSWLVANHVGEGRSKLNFSEWDRAQPPVDELAEKINSGEMPGWQYELEHSNAKLSASEKKLLIAGLVQMYRDTPPAGITDGGGEGGEGGEGD
jgi:hypothetical protein